MTHHCVSSYSVYLHPISTQYALASIKCPSQRQKRYIWNSNLLFLHFHSQYIGVWLTDSQACGDCRWGLGPMAQKKKQLVAEGKLDKHGRPNETTPKEYLRSLPDVTPATKVSHPRHINMYQSSTPYHYASVIYASVIHASVIHATSTCISGHTTHSAC